MHLTPSSNVLQASGTTAIRVKRLPSRCLGLRKTSSGLTLQRLTTHTATATSTASATSSKKNKLLIYKRKSPADCRTFFITWSQKFCVLIDAMLLCTNLCIRRKTLQSAQIIAPLQFYNCYSVSTKPDVLIVYRLHLRNGL